MSAHTPARNPKGQSLGPDDILLQRAERPTIDVAATYQGAFEAIKKHPVETVGGFVFVFVIIGVIIVVTSVLVRFLIITVMAAAGLWAGAENGGNIPLQNVSAMMSWAAAINVGVRSIVGVATFGIVSFLMGGYSIFWLRAVRGEEVSLLSMLEVIPFLVPMILTSLLVFVAVALGSVLLVVPGILLFVGLSMSILVVVDKNLKFIDALKASWAITQGYKGQIFLVGLLTTAINAVGMIPCGLGLFLTVPLTFGAFVSLYDQIAVPGRAYAKDDKLVVAME